jgi:hypothetical protein
MGLNVTWDIQQGGLSLGLKSSSDNDFAFKLNAYTLTANAQYTVVMTVTNLSTRKSSSARVKVLVGQGALQPLIIGGEVQMVKYAGTVMIDASSSLDEDQSGVTGVEAGLNFVWHCTQ